MKIEKISDVTVNIDLVRPQPVIGLGNPAIFVEAAEDAEKSHKAYRGLAALEKDFEKTTDVYAKAFTIFSQPNAPRDVHVITYEAEKIVEAARDYFYTEWHFALLAKYEATAALALSNLIEEQEYKFLVIQAEKPDELTTYSGNLLTIGLIHPLGEHFDAALIGSCGNLTVGSITWKFRGGMKGITENPLSFDELKAVDDANAIAYVSKAGIPQTSEGTTMGGEFIDAMHGMHWVKSSIETKLQLVLSTTDKIDFDTNGIDLLNITVSNVLEEAFSQGIIDKNDEGKGDYSVTTLSRSELVPEDVSARKYKGLSFRYKFSGAIHMTEVNGEVDGFGGGM